MQKPYISATITALPRVPRAVARRAIFSPTRPGLFGVLLPKFGGQPANALKTTLRIFENRNNERRHSANRPTTIRRHYKTCRRISPAIRRTAVFCCFRHELLDFGWAKNLVWYKNSRRPGKRSFGACRTAVVRLVGELGRIGEKSKKQREFRRPVVRMPPTGRRHENRSTSRRRRGRRRFHDIRRRF